MTFEGLDGSGKSTLAKALSSELERRGIPALLTREPGGTELGKSIRSILLDGHEIGPISELFLFLADRTEHMSQLILPALKSGVMVLCDRHADSTVVYQGHGRGLDVQLMRDLNMIATLGVKPDLTFLIDLDVETSIKRQLDANRLGSQSQAFYHAVRQGFLEEAAHEPQRWRILDGSRTPEELLQQALAQVEDQRQRHAES